MKNADDKWIPEDKVEPVEDNFEPYTISETPWGSTVTRIDSSVVMKTSPRCHRGQFAAMRYVAEHAPSVPNPPAHFAQWDLPGGHGRIIMDYVPGKTLHAIWPKLSSDERNGLSYADGQEVLDKFPRSAASVFTHGDIKPKNIIVDEEGKFLTLLDWEMAGFLSDYWESVGMFSRVLEDQVEWAEVMQRTRIRITRDTSPIECEIFESYLDQVESVPYEALSYLGTYGETKNQQTRYE
ncbi:hypothetical protein FJTKL_07061 [Diaporthe vaccinii]|uniref:Aminoglycoside phosphotransferase domain-containing protein n=1 Tax=Diaporthe vaccinii TaxID=105482 RepID=A0ABR4EVF2_9PEZI